MVLPSQSPFALLDRSDYLRLLSRLTWSFVAQELESHEALPLSHQAATAAIINVAEKLKAFPRMLHGANCLFLPRYQIHCSTTSSEVRHFVISNQETHQCEIYSLKGYRFATTSNRQEIQQSLLENAKWDEKFGSSKNSRWLACVAQVLQEIIDDPQTKQPIQVIARRRLGQLAKAGVLPLSVFVHFIDSDIPKFESMQEFSISGGFCDAHKITVNNVPICFRVLRQYENSDSDKIVYKQFCRELSIWHQLRHPNVLPLIGATTEAFPGRYCFIVPWLSNGSLSSFLKRHPEHDKYIAVIQIVEGLNYLHNLNPPVGHKDLKGDNVLVSQDLVCVITDFGVSSLLDTQRSTTRGRGTQYWQAPELGSEEVLDQDCRPRDIYSLGSTISEILTGQAPKTIWFSVLKGIPPILPPPRTPEWGQQEQTLWSIAKICVEATPGKRPVISNIKRLLQCTPSQLKLHSLPPHPLEVAPSIEQLIPFRPPVASFFLSSWGTTNVTSTGATPTLKRAFDNSDGRVTEGNSSESERPATKEKATKQKRQKTSQGRHSDDGRACLSCGVASTPVWLRGPEETRTLRHVCVNCDPEVIHDLRGGDFFELAISSSE